MTFEHRTSKYSGWYFSIIKKAKSESRSKKIGYFENHHIMPECLGGKKTKENMVLLTAREHIVCHRLLIRMFDRSTQPWCSMVFAFKRMIDFGSKNQTRAGVVKTRHIAERKAFHARALSIAMTGKRHTEASKAKMSLKKKDIPLNAEHRVNIGLSVSKILNTPEMKQKLSEQRTGRVMPSTPEALEKRALGFQKQWETRRAKKALTDHLVIALMHENRKPK